MQFPASPPRRRRLAPAIALAVAATAVLAGCAATSSKAATRGVVFGTGKVDLASVTLQVGDQNQLLKTVFAASGEQSGVHYKVGFNQFTDGPHMNAAFSAGRIDVGYMGDTPVLFANASKAGVSVLSAGQAGGGSAIYTLLASSGSNIHSVADLKGKRVGFTRRTALEGWAINLLRTQGLTEKDITPVDLPILSLVSALSSGQVDAVVGTPPGAQTYIEQHPDSVVKVPDEPVYLVVVGRTSALADASKAAALEDFVGRLAKAEAWVRDHKEAFVQAYYVDTLKVPASIGEQLFNLNGNLAIEPVASSGLQQNLQRQHQAFQALGELPATPTVDQLFTPEVIARFDAAVTHALADGTAS